VSEEHGTGSIVLTILDALASGDVLYLADDDQHAESVARALGGITRRFASFFLPSSDTLPGDRAPASPANIGRRVAALRALRRLMQTKKRSHLALIMSGEAAARRYPDPAAFDAAPPTLRVGDAVDSERLAEDLLALGYVCDDRVDEPGEVAVRGDVIDVYPADAGSPVRLALTDGRIAAIRPYDAVSQLTTGECEELEIGRAAEPDGEAGTSILAHLREGTLMVPPQADERRRRFVRLAMSAVTSETAAIDAIADEDWNRAAAKWSAITPDLAELEPVPRFAEQRSPTRALGRFADPLLAEGKRLVLAGSERDLRFLRRRVGKALKLEFIDIADIAEAPSLAEGQAAAIVAAVDRGAIHGEILLIAAADLLGSRALLGEAPATATAGFAEAGGDIRAGDIVVHEAHGFARVLGLESAPDDPSAEVIALEYDGGGRRLVAARDAGRIWRYGVDADEVKLDRLDGKSWDKRKAAIDEALAQSAAALLALAEERGRLAAPVMEPDPAAFERFVGGFPFNETADQARAARAVRDDLVSGKPMDRLVIGDVGFGKTEVALRAAALAALAGFQVIVAAPTTVLVRQHLLTFEWRFAGSGIAVAGLSRLSSAAEKKAVKQGLADGSIGIVVGTAAVMAKDVRYARLGLVIIDEEQRFGAADKARLRGHPEIHLLAMSATPIPRTLHRAMIGLQQISIIATPPARRQPIRTSLMASDDAAIRTALLRERSRRGQSFVVAPRIEDLAGLAERLGRLVPDLDRIEVHGKMPAAEIDAAMVAFAGGDGDILLATNIIEAGLDVPRANTMIVWRADRFGLAQLHQLRGRVGRGNRRGQVLLVTQGDAIAERTMKRLRTLASHDQLGAGFAISAADLDQRGAGDLLSDVQAGHMKLIGVDLYQHLFEAALRQARGEDGGLWVPDINIGSGGTLPAEWIPDADIRLGLYVRLARTGEENGLEAFAEELEDRFGPLPEAAQTLLSSARVAILARAAAIARVDAGPAAIALTPRHDCKANFAGADLSEKEGRWLLKERIPDEERGARVAALLGTLIEDGAEP
jgi:transcription-repair coupling factor (superfamily II helicase)